MLHTSEKKIFRLHMQERARRKKRREGRTSCRSTLSVSRVQITCACFLVPPFRLVMSRRNVTVASAEMMTDRVQEGLRKV